CASHPPGSSVMDVW
nr:immunoglobulin heavy chain junction region [Macaca mulatta]